MSRTGPPAPEREQPDVDALLRALVEEPVPPLASSEARHLRDRTTRGLELFRAMIVDARRRSARRRAWLLFAAAACLPVAIWAATARIHVGATRLEAARVTSLAGQAEIARGGVEQTIAGTGEAPLGPGDELRTGSDASVRASLPTGAVVDVGPWARLRFAATGSGTAVRDRLDLVEGRIEVRVPKLRAGDEVRVRTEDATVVVHGTKFSVERTAASGGQPGATRVTVTEGVVAVETRSGERTLTAGMELVTPEVPAADARAAGAPQAPVLTPAPLDTTGEPSPVASPGPRSTLGAENALLSEAMRLRRGGQSERALTVVDAFLSRYPGSPLTETARVERLRALEDTGATDRLGREAQRYLTDYPLGYARQEASRMLAHSEAHSP
jgi:hypothetical protein